MIEDKMILWTQNCESYLYSIVFVLLILQIDPLIMYKSNRKTVLQFSTQLPT